MTVKVKDITKYEEFLKSFLNSKLTSAATNKWTEGNPEIRIFNEASESFFVNDKEITFWSMENRSPITSKFPSALDIVNRLKSEYVTFQRSADEEDEFQKRTIHENVLPHELNSVILGILEKLYKDNSTEQ